MSFWDFMVNLGAGLANDMVVAIGRQACYCYRFNSLVRDLGDEKDNLIATRDSMLVQVRKAEANNQVPSKNILKQLEETNNLIEKAGKLEGKAEASKSSCYHGVCSNWIHRYNVGKQASRMKEAMNQLNGELRTKLLFAHNQSLRPMVTSGDFILFECTKEAHDELITALKDNEIVRIGLYGMGGCGKSSLLEQVHKAAEESKLFDKVVNVIVSNNPNIRTIQGSIASC